MSTISLPPIKQKILLTRELSYNYKLSGANGHGAFLGDSRKVLEENGNLGINSLILDPGTIIRIEAFKSFSTAEDWPNVKISIALPGKKLIKCYIPLIAFDGVSWDLIKESSKDPKLPISPINKIVINIREENHYYDWNNIYPNEIRNTIFGGYNEYKENCLINPLELSEDELNSKTFSLEEESQLGDAVVKIGKNLFNYNISIQKIHYFDTQLNNGMMSAKRSSIKQQLLLKDHKKFVANEKNPPLFNKEIGEDEITIDNIRSIINQVLKEKHQI